MADDAELSPGIRTSEVLTAIMAKGAAAFGGYQLAKGEKELAYGSAAVSAVAESNWLRQTPSVTGLLLDAGIFTAVYFASRSRRTAPAAPSAS